eukprot:3304675-Amphidinium_carterae.1
MYIALSVQLLWGMKGKLSQRPFSSTQHCKVGLVDPKASEAVVHWEFKHHVCVDAFSDPEFAISFAGSSCITVVSVWANLEE